MKNNNQKMVCAECGSGNVNEERLVSRGINDNVVYGEEVCGYFCRDCVEVIDVMSEIDFLIKMFDSNEK